jgi:hypothetical protein
MLSEHSTEIWLSRAFSSFSLALSSCSLLQKIVLAAVCRRMHLLLDNLSSAMSIIEGGPPCLTLCSLLR